ncbi:transmembrane protein 272 isoform X1 [Lemur catta]|uniref:transmembrane protein 272 isoform X1 n=1 Tax=Lemur catta TaxID=9447 RepID=UPI001E26AC2F|nr:transmembrane protein 272 isoform X1 [Lemur catta]
MPGGLEKACHQCISKIASNACFVCALFAFLALPLSMAFTGMKFLEDCPIQPLIPLYLLVGGIVGTLKVRRRCLVRPLLGKRGMALFLPLALGAVSVFIFTRAVEEDAWCVVCGSGLTCDAQFPHRAPCCPLCAGAGERLRAGWVCLGLPSQPPFPR